MNILSLDIGGTAIKAGLFQNGTLSEHTEVPSRGREGAASLIDAVCGLISDYQKRLPIEAAGISITGQISPYDGHIIFATNSIPGFTGTPFKQILTDRLQIPISVDNDVNCAAAGELHFGAARPFSSFLCVTYGTGIGGAIVMNRSIYHGRDGIAGELGHMTIHAGGKPCVCGKKGCYEIYASVNALIRSVQEETKQTLTGREIFEQFDTPSIRRCIDVWIDEIVCGLASLLHIFNPEAIVLGGGILGQSYVYDEIVRRTKAAAIESFRGTSLVRAELGNLAGMYGAYWNICEAAGLPVNCRDAAKIS